MGGESCTRQSCIQCILCSAAVTRDTYINELLVGGRAWWRLYGGIKYGSHVIQWRDLSSLTDASDWW